MINSLPIIAKARAILGRDLERDELHMLSRLLRANEDDDEKGEDWYVHQLVDAIDYVGGTDRKDPSDEEIAGKAYWVGPKEVTEIE